MSLLAVHGLGSGLLVHLNKLAVRCVQDLQYLCPRDLEDAEKFPIPLVDKRKFLCLLRSISQAGLDASARAGVVFYDGIKSSI